MTISEKEINTRGENKGVYFEKRGGGGHRLRVAYGKEVKCKCASEGSPNT